MAKAKRAQNKTEVFSFIKEFKEAMNKKTAKKINNSFCLAYKVVMNNNL